jgi:DNA polymerase-3 subunit delta
MDREYLNIKKSIEEGDLAPIYLLVGTDSFYADRLVHLIQDKALDESERAFNEFILMGDETEAGQLIDQARQYPMMAQRRLIILKNAQNTENKQLFEKYLENPTDTTIMVWLWRTDKLDKRKRLYKLAREKGVVFSPRTLYENQLPQWIQQYVTSKNRQLDSGEDLVLAEYIGSDLAKLSSEIDKLLHNVGEAEKITSEHVFRYIGISRDFNVFELNKAIGLAKPDKAFLIAKNLLDNIKANDPIFLIAAIFSYFQKALIFHYYKSRSQKELLQKMGLSSAFFLKEYSQVARNFPVRRIRSSLKALAEADLKLKGLGQDKLPREEIFLQLLVQILHPADPPSN